MVDNCVEVVKISKIHNMVTVGLYQAAWTVISFKIFVFQEISRDSDMDAKDEQHKLKDIEANEDSPEKKDTDVTYEEELSCGETEKDGNYSSKDEDSVVRVNH